MTMQSASGAPLFIGIDGGGTHTRAAIVDGDGEVRAVGFGGGSNMQAAGIDGARESIRGAVDRALAELGESADLTGAFLGMAGVVSADDRRSMLGLAREVVPARYIEVDHDIRAALAGGLAGEPGMALIAGTGSSCYGRAADGRSWRAGGWGSLLDDSGGGHWIGLRGMMAITRAADERDPPTALTAPLMRALGIDDIDRMLHLAGSQGLRHGAIAALAPIVLDTAAAGDPTARTILERGAAELAAMAEAVARHLELGSDVAIVLTGGLTAHPLYSMMIRAAIAERLPGAHTISPMLPPVLGAALLALGLGGIAATAAIIDRLRDGYARLDLP